MNTTTEPKEVAMKWMQIPKGAVLLIVLMTVVIIACKRIGDNATVETAQGWKVHDMDRPRPPVIDPGTFSTQDKAGQPPSDAVVLFNGEDISQWSMENGDLAKWKVENGFVKVVQKTGTMMTKKGFGDCQLHVEWAMPFPPKGKDQSRGNSGVFLMGLYEVQVLDSYENDTYPDGQAASVYGQYPPLVNVCRPPGQWQTYDIVFHRPRFAGDGSLSRAARMTVFHNGVLVQDNVVLTGLTAHKVRASYKPHDDRLPLKLQDHGDPVRYRNIWVRELE